MNHHQARAGADSPTFPLGPFVPSEANPILRPRGDSWESGNLYNPAAIVVGDQVVLLYRAHAEDIVSHVGIATSADGIHFEREDAPVVSPEHDYESHGCEDPRVTKVDDTYYLTYTGYDGTTALLCLATSPDLRRWTKHGPLFPEFNTFATTQPGEHEAWSKAGVIHPEPIDGLYYMYFGEGAIFYATSPDLLTWTPCDNDRPIYSPTPGEWDELLVEIGPPPVVTADGLLVLLTNGARTGSTTRVDYRCGQIAIALSNPTEVIAKMTVPWLAPQTPEEMVGLVPNVTFVEGLVFFRGRWLAYYGQSDTTLAVAEFDPAVHDWRTPVGR